MSFSGQAFSGFVYNFVGNILNKLIILLGGIYLARLLNPSDFGLVAMLYIIFSISGFLITGGFGQALIREKEIDEKDKSTVFYFNFSFALFLYILLWIFSPFIANFYNEPQLSLLTKIMGLNLIFMSFTIVQMSVLRRDLKFKKIAIIQALSNLLMMIIVILLAYMGYGVVALAIKFSLGSLISSILLYSLHPWYPRYFISKKSFDKLFKFGSSVMLLGFVNSVTSNFHNVLMGKYFSATVLGFFNQGNMLKDNVVNTFHQSIIGVTYPILSKLQDDTERLKKGYIKITQVNAFLIFPIITILIFSAEPLILFLFGSKWEKSAVFLQILGITGYFGHLHSVNLDILKVFGKGKDYVVQGILRNGITIILIIIAIQYSAYAVAWSLVVADFLQIFINVYYSNKYIKFSLANQFKILLPSILLSLMLSFVLFSINYIQIESNFLHLTVNIVVSVILYISLSYFLKLTAYQEIVNMVKLKLNRT